MKNTIKSVVLCFALAFTTTALSQNCNNGLIGRARGAVHECLCDFHTYNITPQLDVTGTCSGGGEIKRVTFFALPKGPVDPWVKPFIVARVEFDCEGRIISASCTQ